MDRDEIITFIRENTCEECRAGRGYCSEEMELSCITFQRELKRICEEEKCCPTLTSKNEE